MKRLYIGILTILIALSPVNADIFHLKNGETIEGDLINETDDHVIVKIKYGTINIDKNELIRAGSKTVKNKIRQILIETPVFEKHDARIIKSTSQQDLACMNRWLTNQINKKTGLLESFRPTSDMYLEKQGATYDQALAGIGFLILGDTGKAQEILDFYKKKWNGDGFSNFYFTPTGNPGIEYTTHLGPNMWIALFALHYDRLTGKKQYQELAEDIVLWAMKLPHHQGGAAMSNKDEWRAQWSKVVSTENNIDYYAVLNILKERVDDKKFRQSIEEEKFRVADFLTKVAYDKKTGGVNRGFHKGVIDTERALDTISWLVPAAGIDELRRWRIDVEGLIAFVEKRFLVKDGGVKGFDFTDKRGAIKARRKRMVSVEWTLAMINVYCMYNSYYSKSAVRQTKVGNTDGADKLRKRADICENKAVYYLKQMDKTLLKFGQGGNMYAYPYATRSYWLVFFDSTWWRTPKAGIDGTPAGSVASTVWRILAGRFNPLNNNGGME